MAQDERPGALLTPNQRKLLTDDSEISKGSSHASTTRGRIRERLGISLTDFTLINDHLGEYDRDNWFDSSDDEHVSGLVDALATIYYVSTENNLIFEKLLEDAIPKGERHRDYEVAECNVDIELEKHSREFDSLREQIVNGDPEVSRSEALEALQGGIITQPEFWEWADQQESRPSGGYVGRTKDDQE